MTTTAPAYTTHRAGFTFAPCRLARLVFVIVVAVSWVRGTRMARTPGRSGVGLRRAQRRVQHFAQCGEHGRAVWTHAAPDEERLRRLLDQHAETVRRARAEL